MLLRTFVCIAIPKPQLKILSDWLSARRRESHEFRWASPQIMHITLKFCGERPAETVSQLLENLKHIRSNGPFDIQIDGIGGFPDLIRPKVLWAGISGETEALSALRNEVEKAAMRASIPRENKKYTPHITLGRRDSERTLPEETFLLMQRMQPLTGPWTVSEMILMKSELSPIGPRYTPLGLFKI